MKLSANELRIGNYVIIDKLMQESLYDSSEVNMKEDHVQVVSITKDYCNILIDDNEYDFHIKDILPIILTEEWLIKFGAEKCGSFDVRWCLADIYFSYDKILSGVLVNIGNRNRFMNYVHEFQNYLALIGLNAKIA